MFKIGAILTVLSATLFASGGGAEGTTDIVERTFNFVVFAGIIYYLVAEPLKNYLKNRTESIEGEFKRIEHKLKESEDAKEEAKSKVIEAKKKAEEIIADADKEAKLISNKMKKNLDSELAILEKQHSDLAELEESKMVRAVIDEVLAEVLKGDNGLDQDSLTKTLLKKVS